MHTTAIIACMIAVAGVSAQAAEPSPPWSDRTQLVLDITEPLVHPRGNLLPLYLWPAMDPGDLSGPEAERLVREMDERGIGVICSWTVKDREAALERALTVARAQKKLGVRVNVNATSLLYSFFDGAERTAHVDGAGNHFFDDSFGDGRKMGCPFAIDHRVEEIRGRVEWYIDAYEQAGIAVDFIWADWEVDGPIEFNRAHEHSLRCVRCREHIPEIGNFPAFQKALRMKRSELQREVFAGPVRAAWPDALVGNYAVYPHDGYRYWYDYFEEYVDGQPAITEGGAKYRLWYNDFPGTGYTFAMPVVYTWARLFPWYNFADTDYRWFYNMLLVAGNAGLNTPASVPIISFVHHNPINPERYPAEGFAPMSDDAYRELLWHMLLRGTDTFYLWCGAKEYEDEVRPLHEVWAAAREYGEFLEAGTPLTFEMPDRPGPVVSALRLGDRMLVRRSDFGGSEGETAILRVDGGEIEVPPAPGRCVIMHVESAR